MKNSKTHRLYSYIPAFCLFLSACGNGFFIAAGTTKSYDGKAEEYCSLPADFPGLPSRESLPATNELSVLRATAANFVQENRLQEAIWLYQDDPEGATTANSLKKQLNTELLSNDFQVKDSTLGGALEKYILVYPNGIKAIFKPGNETYNETAPYLLDELLQLGLVPMTLEREVQGRKGTVQYFVAGVSGGSPSRVASKNFRKMLVFDFLVRNQDRTAANFLYWGDEDRVIAIDHDEAFSSQCGLVSEIKKHLLIEQTFARKLGSITEEQFDNGMGQTPRIYKNMIWSQIQRIK